MVTTRKRLKSLSTRQSANQRRISTLRKKSKDQRKQYFLVKSVDWESI